jgi:hypothetical protein
MNPAAPAFRRAQAQCFKYMPGGGPPRSGADVAKNKAQMLAISHCMRAHGVSGFPDPISGPPADPSGFSIAIGRPGAFLAVPKTIDIRSPAFEHAASSCGFGIGGHASPAP